MTLMPSVWSAFASLLVPGAHATYLQPRDSVPAGYVAVPYYPSPRGGWVASWSESYAKAEAMVSNMTLAEKTNITAGVGASSPRWLTAKTIADWVDRRCVGNSGSALRVGYRQLCLHDSTFGVASTDNITVFPPGITTGATWDKDLMYKRGVALGDEFRCKGINVYLGPTIGPLGRKVLGGRSWEGFGADPVLQGHAAAATIKGVQEQGVIATAKHLIGNEQEMFRQYNPVQPAYSANIDDRTMHELYLWPFSDAVHAGVGALMCAYNALNSSASCQNSYLLNGLLKDELGFQGFVMSDWLAQLSGVEEALAGLDMAMPGDAAIPLVGSSYWMFEATRAALNGSLPMDRLNDQVTRILAAWYKMGQDKDYPEPNFSANTKDREGLLYPAALLSPTGVVNEYVQCQKDHAVVARQVAQDAITLLKNDGILPLLNGTYSFVVFGTDAAVNPDGPNACGNRACNKGTLGTGWGWGVPDFATFDDPITAIKKRSGNVTFYNTDSFPTVPAVLDTDVAIVFISSDAGENTFTVDGNHGDRDNDKLAAWHDGDKLVQKVAGRYKNVVVVVHTVGTLILESWIDMPQVRAVLFAHLPGQEAGESLTNVLFGDVSPSGHLPYSIVKKIEDYPKGVAELVGFTLGQPQDTYSEGLYIDYRYLNKNGIKPRFAFGHGLSYAKFVLSNATIKSAVSSLSALPPSREAKGPTPVYPNMIPPASEAVEPADFKRIWRFLYSFLSDSDATDAYKIGISGSKPYPYPAGYSNNQTAGPPAGGGEGGHPALFDVVFTVTLTVTNQGQSSSPAKAVTQAYVQYPQGIPYDTPVVQLRDFVKTAALKQGESATVTLSFRRKDLSVWDVEQQNWVIPNPTGRFKIWIGDSSDALFLACYTDTLACEGNLTSPV